MGAALQFPSIYVPVMIAQVNTSQKVSTQRENILGVCELVEISGSGQADIFPVIQVNSYYFRTHAAKIEPATAVISTLQQPPHGHLEPDSRGDWAGAKYLPNDQYLGNDSFVMQVEGSGYKVKVFYFIAVTDLMGEAAYNLNPACKGSAWKISSSSNFTDFPSSAEIAKWPNLAFERDAGEARRPSTLR